MHTIRILAGKTILSAFIIFIASINTIAFAQCPTITVTNPSQSSSTAGTGYSLNFFASGGVGPYTYTTTSSLPPGYTLTSGGVLTGTPIQTGSFPIVVTARDANLCTGTNPTYVYTVVCPGSLNPGTAVPSAQSICGSGTITPVVLSSGIPQTVFNWTRNNTATVTGIAASGTGNISGTLTNTTTSPVTVTFTITPTSFGSCIGPVLTSTVIVNPSQTVNQPANQAVCNNGTSLPVSFTGSGSTFRWTNNNPSIGLPASGTGNIASFTATNTTNAPVTATVTVTPTFASGSFAYLTSQTTPNSIAVLNLATNSLVATIDVGSAPWQVLASPDGSRVYVEGHSPNILSIINTATNTVISSLNVGGTNPWGVGLSPDGSRVYIPDASDRIVRVVNTATNTVVATIPGGGDGPGIVVSSDGGRIYCANNGSTSVEVSSTVTNTVVASIDLRPTVTAIEGLAISPDGSRVYTTSFFFDGNSVGVINTATNTVIASIVTGTNSRPRALAISPDGTRLYVSNFGSNTVSVINTATNTVMATISVGTQPYGISITPDGSRVYVSAFGGGTYPIYVINTTTNTVLTTITPGAQSISVSNFIAGNVPTCAGTPRTFTITVNPTATVNAVANQVFCNGIASAPVNFSSPATGGTITYNWTNSNTAIGLGASGASNIPTFIATNTTASPITATITVTPTYTNGSISCAGTPRTFTITVNPSPATPVITAGGPTSFCQGGSVTLSAPAGFSYLWSNGATTQSIVATLSGNYSVTVTNANNCSASSAATTVSINPRPPVPVVIQTGNTLFSSSPTGNQWYLNGTIIAGATAASYTYMVTGDYSVTVTNAAGCSSSSSIVTAGRNAVVQITDTERFYYNLFPNPVASSQLTIEYQLEQPHTVGISLFNMNGRRITIQGPVTRTAGRYTLNANTVAERLRKGVYILQFAIDGKQVTRTIIKL